MQLPEIVQWLDVGQRTALLVLVSVLYVQVRAIKAEFMGRIGRLEGMLMRPPDHPSHDNPGGTD